MEYLNELELDLEAQFMEYLPKVLQTLNLGTSKSGYKAWGGAGYVDLNPLS